MSQENNAPGATAPNAPVSADAAPAPASTQAAAGEEPLRNYREVVDLKKSVRETNQRLDQVLQMLSQQQTPAKTPEPGKSEKAAEHKPDAAMAAVAELKRELALKDAFIELGVKSPEQRELIEAAVAHKNPENLREFVAKYAGTISQTAAKAEPVTAAPPPQAKPVSNAGGAPSTDGKLALPTDLFSVDPGHWRGLTPEQKKQVYENFKRAHGADFNPWAPNGTTK